MNQQALQDVANGFLLVAPCKSFLPLLFAYWVAFQALYNRVSGAFRRLLSGNSRHKGAVTNNRGDWCWKDDCCGKDPLLIFYLYNYRVHRVDKVFA